MNRTKLKNYAPQARTDFIQAITDRAAFYGLTAMKTEPLVSRGDVVVIAGREHPRSIAQKREKLEARIKRHGFEQTMEALAYTWFNRLVAIRFMELHGYLDHGYRVLSHPEGKPAPEILERAEYVDLPGLQKEAVIDLKLAGGKEADLYRRQLIAQCNSLSTAMPFLFEKIEDETELVLPDNLLHSDSLIRKLVNEIDEEDWQEVEVIGWLYQFYISEKKDQVIGKVVASEDIPAATQLFTPNWIVRYLVQNALGRQWLATYPQSPLRQQMEYYIEPAEQTPEVQEQLKAITPTTLDPEELTLLDPACGSGHILVEAYDLFKAIYQERGYRAKDIPALILQKNLYGLEIDDRAAQLAAFALMMKARADDRRIFASEAKPNVVAFQDSQGMDAADLTETLNSPIPGVGRGKVAQGDVASLLALFKNAKTFGSLIQVPPALAARLPEMEKRLDEVLLQGDLAQAEVGVLEPMMRQARLLARQYDAVVANPPYMGSNFHNASMRDHLNTHYYFAKADLFSSFMERAFTFGKPCSIASLVTMQSWMFLSTYASLRNRVLEHRTILNLTQIGCNSFPSMNSKVARACVFACQNHRIPEYVATFIDLESAPQSADKQKVFAQRTESTDFHVRLSSLSVLPGSPIAYWISDPMQKCFQEGIPLASISRPMKGMFTGNDAAFVRFHWEVSSANMILDCDSHASSARRCEKWYPYLKGGDYRKWYGNVLNVVNHQNDGIALRASGKHGDRNPEHYFLPCLTWSDITTSNFVVRYTEQGALPSSVGNFIIAAPDMLKLLSGLLCSKIATEAMRILNPTFHANPGDVAMIPVLTMAIDDIRDRVLSVTERAVDIARTDWDSTERSIRFSKSEMIEWQSSSNKLVDSYNSYATMLWNRVSMMKELEEENNRLFIEAYGLQDELSPEVPDDQITLYRPDRQEDIKRLISYAVGCMMGRYSLDKPGLIYAHSGNQGFDPAQYATFAADEDGIIPLFETDWGFADDATNRLVEFISVAWPREHLEENLKFIADSLGPNGTEQPRDTIRRYFATGFYKHHLPMYKRRPIYWLFSSGKQRAFQCLVYLHRYHEGTLARMRTEYVIPLQGQIASRIEQLEGDKAQATSTSHRKKLQKEQDGLKKQQAELLIFEEKLKHVADMKIRLDLDDGVKVNYGKFGDLLAETKAVTGGTDE